MTTLTLAQLLGKPGYGDKWDMDRQIEISNKATSGSSAIAPGRITVENESTGVWTIATAGSTGKMGVVPALAPINVDADDTFNNVTGIGAEIYIEAGGAIKPGARVMPTTGGKGIQFVAGDVTATPDESTIEAAIAVRAPFVYMGHYGEGSGHGEPATDAANGQAIRVRIQPY